MTTYSEKSFTSLTTGASDSDGDTITVRRINGAVPSSWPYTVTLLQGIAEIDEDGVVVFDDGGDTSGHPLSGFLSNGSFTFTLWDGLDESPTYTATVGLEGGAGSSEPEQPDPLVISNVTSSGFDILTPAAPVDGGAQITHYTLSLLPKGDLSSDFYGNGSWLRITSAQQTISITAANYPGLTTDSEHVAKIRAVNSVGAGPYSADAEVTLPAPANPPVFTTQPSFNASSFDVGDTVTLNLGGGTGDNSVTVSIEHFRLDSASKVGELSGLTWNSAGEPAGTLRLRTRLTDDVTGAFVLSGEVSVPLNAVGGTGVPPGFTPVTSQSALNAAISAGTNQIFLNSPGNYTLNRSVSSLPSPFTLQGTASTIVDVTLTGSKSGLDVTLKNFKVTKKATFQANVRTMTRDGVLFHGPSSGVRGSDAYDRMLRATLNLRNLSSQPQVGQSIANSNGTASSTITKVYDWNAGAKTATVAINDVPGKSTGGSKEGNRWANGQGLRLNGANAGTVGSSLMGGDPVNDSAIAFSSSIYPQNDVYRNCDFKGWIQQIAAFGSVTTVVENNTHEGFTADAIKVFRRSPHPNATITIRGNRVSGVLVNPEYHGNPHMDGVQIQPTPVNTSVQFTGQVLIERNIMTARGFNPIADLQSIIIHQHRNTNVVIRNNLFDTLRGPRGISGGGSRLTCTNNTFISSDPGPSQGGVRAGRVDMTGDGGSTFIGNITEVILGGNTKTNNIELGAYGGSNNAAYGTHFQTARYNQMTGLTGDPIVDLLAWATPKSAAAQNIGGVTPSGVLRS